MKKYYILRADGSSVFENPYPEDFCFHCLFHLLDTTPDEAYMLCYIQPDPLFPAEIYGIYVDNNR